MKKLIMFFLLILSHSLFAEVKTDSTCIDKGELRYIYNTKLQKIPSSYCFNKTRTTLVSKSCHEGASCEAKNVVDKYKERSFDLFNNGVGAPGFNLCYGIQGRPQIVEFFDGKKWFKLDRCIFEKDESYIDTGMLVKLWRKK